MFEVTEGMNCISSEARILNWGDYCLQGDGKILLFYCFKRRYTYAYANVQKDVSITEVLKFHGDGEIMKKIF